VENEWRVFPEFPEKRICSNATCHLDFAVFSATFKIECFSRYDMHDFVSVDNRSICDVKNFRSFATISPQMSRKLKRKAFCIVFAPFFDLWCSAVAIIKRTLFVLQA